MKKLSMKALLVLAATPLLFLASCSKNDGQTKGPEPKPEGEIMLNAKLNKLGEATKVVGGATEFQLLWQKGDEIGMYYFPNGYTDDYSPQNIRTKIVGEGGNELASFASSENLMWLGEAASHEFIGIYPYTEAITAPNISALPVTVASEQPEANNPQKFSKNMFMIAQTEVPEKTDTPVEMAFSTPLAIVKIVIDAEDSNIAEQTIKSISMNSSLSFAGTATYNANANASQDKFTGFTGKNISSELNADAKLNPTLEAYFYVYPVDLSGDDANVQVAIEAEDFTGKFNIYPEEAFEAGKINTINININQAIKNGDGTMHFTADVAEEFANAHILHPNNAIIIPIADIWDIWENEFDLAISETGTIGYKVVWVDTDKGYSPDGTLQTVAVTKIDESGERDKDNMGIYVKAGNLHGNALVALTVNGQIRWSWHIWVTDYNPTTTYKMANGFKIMDRNIGAMTNEVGALEAIGMHYEGGRKDPFPGTNGEIEPGNYIRYRFRPQYDEHGEELVVGVDGITTWKTTYPTEMATVQYATEHPNTYLLNAVGNYELWEVNAMPEDGEDGTPGQRLMKQFWVTVDGNKTIWDPCPAGWRVPQDEEATMFDNVALQDFAMGSGINVPEGYFPAAGAIINAEIRYYGDTGIYWYSGHRGWGQLIFEFMPTRLRLPSDRAEVFRTTGCTLRCVAE